MKLLGCWGRSELTALVVPVQDGPRRHPGVLLPQWLRPVLVGILLLALLVEAERGPQPDTAEMQVAMAVMVVED